MKDSAPEVAELISQAAEVETEAEMERLLNQIQAVSAVLGREADKYLAKKGVRRKVSGHDVEAIEEDFLSLIEPAKAQEALELAEADPRG